MAIDVKILINGGFRYLIKTCYQWAKEHLLVSGVMLFFYLMYIFLPSLFNIAFYTFPLVICAAILLGKRRVSLEKRLQNEINNVVKMEDCKPKTTGDRPYLRSQMSKRTFGKDKNKDTSKTETRSKQQDNNGNEDQGIHKILEEEIMPMKFIKAKSLSNLILEKTQSPSTSASRSVSDSEEDNDEPQEERNRLVEWTEDDQRNLMDLGSSEIERNKRLENLIAKRRARKLLSMQPRRNIHIEYLANHSFDDHIYQVGVIARAFDDVEHHKPGSSRSVRFRSSNPFDLPYDPLEEKPVLTGGSFDEEFFPNVQKDLPFCRHESFKFTGAGEHPLAKSLPSFFLKKPCFTQLRSNDEGLYQQESPQRDEESSNIVCHDQPTISPSKEGKHQSENSVQIIEPAKSGLPSSTEGKKEHELKTKDVEENIQTESSKIVGRDEIQLAKDRMSKKQKQDGAEEGSSSSSSSPEIRVNATKNEAFRNSVKKVLTCLVLQRNKCLLENEELGSTSSDPLQDSSIADVLPTKMEERSLYTVRPHHVQRFSIASDMQVEVSETGSPTSGPPDLNSPTDQESLVYDGDVDKDANSGDEDLWGASPHPVRLGDLGAKFQLPDIRSSEFGTTLSGAHGEVAEQAQGGTSFSSILPEDNRQEIIDQRSTNGDIIDPRTSPSSLSSSSPSLSSSLGPKGLASQVQGKSEHLAEFLANLPSSETGSNMLEDPGPSHVQERSADVISIQDESNALFEMEEDKEDSKESKLSAESQRNSEQTTSRGQSEALKEAFSASKEHGIGELIKKHEDHDQATVMEELKDQPRGLKDGSQTAMEEDINSRKPLGHQNVVVSVSLSTTYKEETEEPNPTLVEDTMCLSENQIQGEVTTVSPNSPFIYDESTSPKEPTSKGNRRVQDVNEFEAEEAGKGGKENMQERKGELQSTRVEEGKMKPPSKPREINSKEIHNPRWDKWSERYDASFD